jgi:predicted XRE-type DNA-binding protein
LQLPVRVGPGQLAHRIAVPTERQFAPASLWINIAILGLLGEGRDGLVSLTAGIVSQLENQLLAEVRAYQLAEIRRARRLTQRQVAEEMGVTTARVSQIEHGQVDRAAIRGLAGYVEALGGHLELIANFGDKRVVIG